MIKYKKYNNKDKSSILSEDHWKKILTPEAICEQLLDELNIDDEFSKLASDQANIKIVSPNIERMLNNIGPDKHFMLNMLFDQDELMGNDLFKPSQYVDVYLKLTIFNRLVNTGYFKAKKTHNININNTQVTIQISISTDA